jgi:hypothetical protein
MKGGRGGISGEDLQNGNGKRERHLYEGSVGICGKFAFSAKF